MSLDHVTRVMKSDTAANWSTSNPVLAAGEWGLDTTNQILKVGDDATAWNSLRPALWLGASAAYTPTFNNITLGSATVSSRYKETGGLVYYQGDLLFAADTVLTDTLQVSLPVTPASGLRQRGEASYSDASSGLTHIGSLAISNLGSVTFPTSTGTSVNAGANPFVWTTNDRLVWSLAYLPN